MIGHLYCTYTQRSQHYLVILTCRQVEDTYTLTILILKDFSEILLKWARIFNTCIIWVSCSIILRYLIEFENVINVTFIIINSQGIVMRSKIKKKSNI